MVDCATLDEFNKKVQRNQRMSGFGPMGTAMHLPCPGCAASDWKTFKVIESRERMPEPATCRECARTFKIPVVSEPLGDGGVSLSLSFVQIGGSPVPAYLQGFVTREK